MLTRESNVSDHKDIIELHREAFGEEEGESVSKLVADLLDDESAQPLISLLAEDGERLLGHIIFTSVRIDDAEKDGGYILAPLAVANVAQGQGVGTRLIEEGLMMLKERDAKFVLVLGDPNYYKRSGFHTCHKIKPPYDIDYPEAWMALELKEGSLKQVAGTAHCATSLSAPEHW